MPEPLTPDREREIREARWRSRLETYRLYYRPDQPHALLTTHGSLLLSMARDYGDLLAALDAAREANRALREGRRCCHKLLMEGMCRRGSPLVS